MEWKMSEAHLCGLRSFVDYMAALESSSSKPTVYFQPGRYLIDDVITGCTIGGIPGSGARTEPLPNEDWNAYSRAFFT